MKRIIISAIKWFGIAVVADFALLLIMPIFGVSDTVASNIGDAVLSYLPIAGVVLDLLERRIRRAKSEEAADEKQLTTR